jgi:hypothetical protein
MGRLARSVLVDAANTDPSQEVRSRCAALLPKANALEMRARLEVFMADTEGKYDHDLQGWNQFRNLIRDEWSLFGYQVSTNAVLDKSARAVFADMITGSVNRQIVMMTGGGQVELGQLVADRRQELYNQKYPRTVVIGGMIVRPAPARDPSAEDIAVLLFAETHVSSKFVPRGVSVLNLVSTSNFLSAAKAGDDKGRIYRAIASAWLESKTDPIDMYQSISIASNLGLNDQATRMAVKLMTAPGVPISYRGQGAMHLARLGTKEHLPLLEKSLTDATVAYTIRENVTNVPVQERPTHDVQVRDMALAVSVLISGQNLDEYGFVDNLRSNGALAGTKTYSYSRYYIPEADRKKMFEKWKAWREKNP